MKKTYLKVFPDRYTLLHEQQILDYLNQRSAPVPVVRRVDLDQSIIEMDEAGQDMWSWIHHDRPAPEELFNTLSRAIDVILTVADLGVWHLDIALRNLVVSPSEPGHPRLVLLIDFANSISDGFPLQKPLWMLPAAHQHPELRHGLTQDWQSFYTRLNLAHPQEWDKPFEIPKDLYQQDWTEDLKVEAIEHRWCVLAHSVGQLILREVKSITFLPEAMESVGSALLNLNQEDIAKKRLRESVSQLNRWKPVDQSTPRPTLRGEPSNPTSSELSYRKKINPQISLGETMGLPHAASHRLKWPAPGFYIGFSFGLLAIAAGWFLIDIAYSSYRINLTWLGWLGLAVVSIGSLFCIVRAALLADQKWAIRILLLHTACQALLLVELWGLNLPFAILRYMIAILFCIAAVALLLERRR